MLICTLQSKYSKSGNFRDNLIFANSVKIRICDAERSRLGHDLPISLRQSDFGISRGFYFHETSHMRSFAKINPRENFRIYSITVSFIDIQVMLHTFRTIKSLDAKG